MDTENVHTEEEFQVALLETAAIGLILQDSLDIWNSNFHAWKTQSLLSAVDSRSILAKIYHHAISIYLSGLFDYRFQYNDLLNPTLPFDTIQYHVDGILRTVAEALQTTNLAGLLFFFPLRVAGARAESLEHKKLILGMLKEISNRSFVVAGAFVKDLESLWDMNGP